MEIDDSAKYYSESRFLPKFRFDPLLMMMVMVMRISTSCSSVVKHDEENVGGVKEGQADQQLVEEIGLEKFSNI